MCMISDQNFQLIQNNIGRKLYFCGMKDRSMPANLEEGTCKNFASAENKGEMIARNKLYKEGKINFI